LKILKVKTILAVQKLINTFLLMKINKEGKPPSDSIGESRGYILWQSAMHWQRNVNHVLAAFDLTYTQFVVLAITGWLKRQKQQAYQHQVAKFARIDRMMTSRVIANLERKGYIQRVKKADDARANLVRLTALGEKTMKKALGAVEKLEDIFFKEKSAEEKNHQRLQVKYGGKISDV